MKRIVKPPVPDWSGIPDAMKHENRWVLWRSMPVLNEETGQYKNGKVPCSPTTGERASAQDTRNWLSFTEAQTLCREGGFGGIGFALGDGWAGIDMDSCIDTEGYLDWGPIKPGINLNPELDPDRIVETFETDAYIEVSPSGKGLHIIARGKLPPGRRKLALSVSDAETKELACYDAGRFFTITGRKIAGNCALADTTDKLQRLHSLAFPQAPVPSRSAGVASTVSDLGDNDLIERALKAANGGNFRQLWEGNHTGYPSQSEADLALCDILAFWTGRDEARIDQLFRQSGLMREKWEREDYREGTIAKACEATTDTYSPPKAKSRAAAHRNGAAATTISEPEIPMGVDERNGSRDTAVLQEPDTDRPLELVPDEQIEEGEEPDLKPKPSAKESPYPKPIRQAGYYGVIGKIVRAIEPHTEADPNFLLVSLLVAAGNYLGRNAHIEVSGARHYTNLFVCGVGTTGTGRKGTAMANTLRFLKKLEDEYSTGETSCIEPSSLSSGEGIIARIKDPVYKPAKGSKERELEDPGRSDKRILSMQDELGPALQNMKRTGNNLSGILRTAWDGGDLGSLTKSPYRATNPHVSMITSITREELIGGIEPELMSGFANRFLWCCSKQSRKLPEGGALDESVLEPYAARFMNARRYAASVGLVKRDAGANQEWGTNDKPAPGLYTDLNRPRVGKFSKCVTRAHVMVLRMALIYALLDYYADTDGNLVPCEIRKEHLFAAAEVWRYCEDSARYIFGESTGNDMADAILTHLRSICPEGATRTEICQKVFQNNRTAEEISVALSRLLNDFESPLLRSQCEKKPGAKKTTVTYRSF